MSILSPRFFKYAFKSSKPPFCTNRKSLDSLCFFDAVRAFSLRIFLSFSLTHLLEMNATNQSAALSHNMSQHNAVTKKLSTVD